MHDTRHTARLADTQTRLERLVSIRNFSGFTRAEQAEFRELSVVEQALLGVLRPYRAR